MDLIILFVAKLLCLLVLLTIFFFVFYICFVLAYRIYKNIIGLPIAIAAFKEYRKTHPEAFAHFDKIEDPIP